ncbi:hypothetical protein SEA_PHEDRO_49 [Microbacterium phage Phedro]|uniref:Uncharacterized protein n=2 Tax=Akonivirus phedro TaxID=2845594 RepID=A0A6M3TB76_9CAUD|nr:hypothetical protein HWD33_gp49 [Microbacterium phage Phedro]QJD52956.1 hypothetical protein SEA_PHEDRO_49 [Microbacterium phage Phedro]QJD53011.1 hypothetical protein SEA_PHARKY_49 [Microbacterium phage Pharky]
MSDATNVPASDQEPWVSGIDPAFSQAFNFVHSQEDEEETVEGAEAAEPAGDGAETPAAPAEGAAAGAADDAAPAGGTDAKSIPSAADLIQRTLGEQSEAGADGAAASEDKSDAAGAAGPAAEGVDPATVIPAFAAAGAKITERMENTFKAQAMQELQTEIDEVFINGLKLRPMQMVGLELPSLRQGAGKDEKVKILDSQMARDWQETVTGLLEDEIADKVQQKTEEVRSMTSVIQESILLGQNNPDLIPGTVGFDKELAERFTKIAKAYEVKTQKGVIGYAVNVQPLINELRSSLAAERGATSANKQNEERAAQQRAKAAAQPRTEEGKFDQPQAGIQSKSGQSGKVEEGYDHFWSALKMHPGGSNLSI